MSASDLFRAALIMQHGSSPEDFALAHELASKLLAMDPQDSRSKQLFAVTKDRNLLSLGRKQLYATQYVVENNVLRLSPVEDDATVDEARSALGLIPLAEWRRRLAEMFPNLSLSTAPR
jgi:hypothetical protein